jgi:7,8-dihydroneopterin aldolase/epimerase/oxygenase
MNASIVIRDLEVHYHVGVPESERAHPQRLLVSLEMEVDVVQAIEHDDVSMTVDYHQVVQRLLAFGQNRSWKLLETLAWDMGSTVLDEFPVRHLSLEIKKYILPETRYVSVRLSLSPPAPAS